MRITGWVIGLLLAFVQLQAAQDHQAPAFQLSSSSGSEWSSDSLMGRITVLEWINLDCPFVKNHYNSTGAMPTLQQRYRGKGIQWISICSSASGKQGNLKGDELAAKLKAAGWAGSAYLMDETGTVGKAYGAKTTPFMVVINPAGQIVYEGAIDSKPGTKPEDIKGADPYLPPVLEALLWGDNVDYKATRSYGCSVKYAN